MSGIVRAEHVVERAEQRRERMLAAPNFRDGRFMNPSGKSPALKGSGFNVMREYLTSKVVRRPPGALPMLSPINGWRDRSHTGLRATWLGHSTVLIELDGARILTDPVWANRASPFKSLGPKRFHRPPVEIAELPPLDAILISHDHYDHYDAAAVRTLARTQTAPFVTALGVGDHLERHGVPPERIIELAWWEQAELPRTAITVAATPAQHFSGRGVADRNKTLWASYVFRGPRHRVYFSGDTGLEPELGKIAELFGPFDLLMLEVGAYHPSWGDIHLGPDQAMEAHRALGSAPFLPVHWSTFDLALHAWDEPIVALEAAVRESGLPLIAPRLGESRDVRDRDDVERGLTRFDAWWREVSPPM